VRITAKEADSKHTENKETGLRRKEDP